MERNVCLFTGPDRQCSLGRIFGEDDQQTSGVRDNEKALLNLRRLCRNPSSNGVASIKITSYDRIVHNVPNFYLHSSRKNVRLFVTRQTNLKIITKKNRSLFDVRSYITVS